MPYNNKDHAGKALSSIKKEYAIIGKHHIRAWHLWLFAGVLAGAVGAIALVARNSAEEPLALRFEKSSAAPTPPILNSIRILSPNGGEILVTGQRTQVRWESNISLSTIPQIVLVPANNNPEQAEYILGQDVPNDGQFLFTVPIGKGGFNGDYIIHIGVSSDIFDFSDTPFRVVSSINTPAISSVAPIYNTIRPGDDLGISLIGVNFGNALGVLDILDSNGGVAASFSGSKPDFWSLAWSQTGIVLNLNRNATAGLTPGVYVLAARVYGPFGGGKGQQVYSNIVPFSFTVK